mmetsp:Transcript_9959/g.23294  ORF Transcript_9959/g.23294 Transcript_9959/m.23294 type:complete len:425 (-) Transcript_9959:35-1309(-)
MAKGKKRHRSRRSSSGGGKGKTPDHSPNVSFARTYKSRKYPSERTKAATVALDYKESSLSKSTMHGRRKRARDKQARLDKTWKVLTPERNVGLLNPRKRQRGEQDLQAGPVEAPKGEYVFFDGSPEKSQSTFPLHARPGNIVRSVHELRVYSEKDGVTYTGCDTEYPDFLMCPQHICLEMLDLDSFPRLPEHAKLVIDAQGKSTDRHCLIVSDSPDDLYAGGIGCVVPLGRAGVMQYSRHFKKVPIATYNTFVRLAARMEKIALAHLPSKVVQYISAAKDVAQFKTMKGVGLDSDEEPYFFASIACGINLVLSSHIDNDFFYCVVVALNPDYTPQNKDKVLVYFTFPTLGSRGKAVAMKHGQILIFNARQYHSISSRKFANDRITCISLYLKTAVVSGHDSSIELTEYQERCAQHYKDIMMRVN